MKTVPTDQTYVVLEQTSGLSKITGRPMTTITMVGTRDRKEYKTYIDTNNHNHDNWLHITNNPTNGFILTGLSTKEHKGKLLVNADSKPVIAAECLDKESILASLQETWKEQDNRRVTRFKDLFE